MPTKEVWYAATERTSVWEQRVFTGVEVSVRRRQSNGKTLLHMRRTQHSPAGQRLSDPTACEQWEGYLVPAFQETRLR